MSSTCPQHSANAMKVLCMHCECRESAENRQQELSRNVIECHASSVEMPWLLQGQCKDPVTGPFSKKISGISCDLTALWKIKQYHGNAVETRLGVTGALIWINMLKK